MRIVPLLIAALVTVGLYFFVFQREALLRFAGVQTEEVVDATEASDAQGDPFAPPAEQVSGAEEAVSVVAKHSTARTLDRAVILRGETEAAREVAVSAETGGRMISEPLRKGAYVEADQILCKLDPGTRDATLASARAGLPSAEARVLEAKSRLSEAETNLDNAKKLAAGGYASDTRVISAEAALESARAGLSAALAGVDAARAQLAGAERDIERLTIRAPFAGLLESDTAELGALMQPGSVCATVIQLDPIKLVGYAPEAEVDRIEVGTLAGARLVSGREVAGRVTFLSRSADPTTRTFRVEIEIPNPGFEIRDGQTVEMAISSDGTPAHLVAQSSLTLDDNGQIGLRAVGEDSRVVFHPVQVLRDTREGIWVAGLPDTLDIITVGQEYVRAGVLVEPTFGGMTQ